MMLLLNNSQKSQNHSAKMVELICSILNDAEVDYIRNGYSNGLKGTLNLSFRGKDGEAILHRLDLRGILVSTGSACDSNSVQVKAEYSSMVLNAGKSLGLFEYGESVNQTVQRVDKK